MESVILDEGVKERIVADVAEFRARQRWYLERGRRCGPRLVSAARGWLGVPVARGTGKEGERKGRQRRAVCIAERRATAESGSSSREGKRERQRQREEIEEGRRQS